MIFVLYYFSDGSDRQKYHSHHHRRKHHHRQRRHGVETTEWSPSQALIHEKRRDGSVKSEITFGIGSVVDQTLEDWVFLTQNATTVRAHIGSTAILPCDVKKDSQFGMVGQTIFISLLY